MRYSYNPCTVCKTIHYHLVPDFTTNPTSFIRHLSWEDYNSQTEFSETLLSWQDDDPSYWKTSCGCWPITSSNTWWAEITHLRPFCCCPSTS
jgi:hypothetical protein